MSLSDAAESGVNLVAALSAFFVLHWAARPAVAAGVIGYTVVDRLLNPRGLNDVGIGLAVAVVPSAINLGITWVPVAAAKRSRSLVYERACARAAATASMPSGSLRGN